MDSLYPRLAHVTLPFPKGEYDDAHGDCKSSAGGLVRILSMRSRGKWFVKLMFDRVEERWSREYDGDRPPPVSVIVRHIEEGI